MGKHKHAKQSNSAGIPNANANANEKTSSGSKWTRKFNVLDYHRWHYIKKVLAHKKHHEGRDVTESDSRATASNNDHCSKSELVDNSQFEAQNTDSSGLKKSLPLPSSPQSKSSTLVPLSPTKSSRAERIKKMIAKEVTKRTGRHRRSSTCPASSELGRTSLADQHVEIPDEGLGVESKSAKMSRQDVASEGDYKTCDLCCTRNIECKIDSTLVGEEAEHQVDQDMPNTPPNRLPFKGKIDRSASLHHSRDFLDTLDVLSMNKDFFLRVSVDYASPRKDDQVSRSSNRSSLMKSGTFPINDPSCTRDSSFPSSSNLKQQDSYTNENNSLQMRIENTSSSHGDQIAGRRFKDLRHKIKHLIKENRKERRRIAMDAVLHKVPFGQKVSEESVNESPCAGICETDSSVSPNSNKGKKVCRRRRSPSLDESLDKYCQLFETTSFSGREPCKTNEPQSSRLRVMDENLSRSQQKGLARILSSPNLDMFSSYRSVDCDGYISSKTPNRRIMSFSERKVEDVSNIDMENRMQFDANIETCKDLEEYVNDSNAEAISYVNKDDEDAIVDQGDTTRALEVGFDDINDGVITTQSTDTILQPHPHMDSYEHDRTLLEDVEVAESEELSSESPTFSYTVVDEDTENSQIRCISPKHHHIQVRSSEIAEFNYVRDILQLSGYSGNQLLGTWYSSEQPVDPSVFIELESSSLVEPQCSSSPSKEGDHTNHLLLFDLINEVLLAIYETSVSYWSMPLCSSSCSQTHPMPKGYYVLKEVWNCINWYIGCSRPELDPSLDYITTCDLAKYDGWMNLQFDAECVGLELEDLIFDDLLSEVTS